VDLPRTEKRLLPPVYFLLAIGVMIGLHFVLPLARWVDGSERWVGSVPIFFGAMIAGIADAQFKRRGTTVKPFQPSTAFVTGGTFRISRNPMYLALTLILIGIGVCLGSASPFVVVPLFVWLITVKFIRHEEASLGEQFGEAYTRYKQGVRRWL
jgi:protein-S-isoprenylcysteine O-methyltransferase Ste14